MSKDLKDGYAYVIKYEVRIHYEWNKFLKLSTADV